MKLKRPENSPRKRNQHSGPTRGFDLVCQEKSSPVPKQSIAPFLNHRNLTASTFCATQLPAAVEVFEASVPSLETGRNSTMTEDNAVALSLLARRFCLHWPRSGRRFVSQSTSLGVFARLFVHWSAISHVPHDFPHYLRPSSSYMDGASQFFVRKWKRTRALGSTRPSSPKRRHTLKSDGIPPRGNLEPAVVADQLRSLARESPTPLPPAPATKSDERPRSVKGLNASRTPVFYGGRARTEFKSDG
jgi:hypothetical protein